MNNNINNLNNDDNPFMTKSIIKCMFVRYANKVFIWTKAKDSPTNEEYNISYVVHFKDEDHNIYEKEEDKPPAISKSSDGRTAIREDLAFMLKKMSLVNC